MKRPAPPSRPYTGPPNKFTRGDNKPIRRIVVHSTVSPCEPGGARKISAYFRSARAGGSAHYVVDPKEAVQSAWDSVICWHAPPNPGTIGVEMCDMPGPVPPRLLRPVKRRTWRWKHPEQREMLERTAVLVGQLCAAYGVPPWFRGVRALKAGRHGVTTHACVSQAFHQSTHWDPGWWPRLYFMRRVRVHYKRAMAGAGK